MIGIKSYGAYIPRLRLKREAIYRAMGWFSPLLIMGARGERTMGNWDEDTLTMAVAAAREAIKNSSKQDIDSCIMASTTFPFEERQNSQIVCEALNLHSTLHTQDLSGSQRAGTNALITALEMSASRKGDCLIVASDMREARPGSIQQMYFGDGAASLIVGSGKGVIAKFLGSHSISTDFNHQIRARFHRYDYLWEDRWARDEGYIKILPRAINELLSLLDLTPQDISRFIYPSPYPREHKKIAGLINAKEEQIQDNLHHMVGDTGCAHPLLMLVHALEGCLPGEKLVIAGFGHGANALCFEVTPEIEGFQQKRKQDFSMQLKDKKVIDNYLKFLAFRGEISVEMGLRSQGEKNSPLSVLWRNKKMLLALVGGRCMECGTVQFPRTRVCVNPHCGAVDSQQEYEFSHRQGRIITYTGDMLAPCIDPPHQYGIIEFEGGGRILMDFTDCEMEELEVGLPMEMVFRLRTTEKDTGFRQYFWKARPIFPQKKGGKDEI